MTELRLAAENIQDLTSKESVIRMAMGMDMLRTADYNMVKKVFDMLSATATQDPKDRFAKLVDTTRRYSLAFSVCFILCNALDFSFN